MIYITGDTHIPIDIGKLSNKNWPEQKSLTKSDYLIITGDFGLIWYPPGHKSYREDVYWRNWLENKEYNILFVDGNHENFDLLETYPKQDMFNGTVRKIGRNIFHLMRGEIYNIDGKSIFTFGGAKSHDRGPGDTWWWEAEEATLGEMGYGVENLTKHNNTIDYIITHDGPQEVLGSMLGWKPESTNTNRYLYFLSREIKFKGWYFGHHHIDKDYGKYHAMYDRILRLE